MNRATQGCARQAGAMVGWWLLLWTSSERRPTRLLCQQRHRSCPSLPQVLLMMAVKQESVVMEVPIMIPSGQGGREAQGFRARRLLTHKATFASCRYRSVIAHKAHVSSLQSLATRQSYPQVSRTG